MIDPQFQFIAIILLFIVILAYIHIEEANSRAIADMEDQRDNAYYSLSDLILNRLRFHLASDVTMTSRVLASILVCCSSVYLLSAVGLLIGIYKSREEFVLLWLVLQFFFFVAGCVFTFWVSGSEFVEHTIGKVCFCKLFPLAKATKQTSFPIANIRFVLFLLEFSLDVGRCTFE